MGSILIQMKNDKNRFVFLVTLRFEPSSMEVETKYFTTDPKSHLFFSNIL